jgi:hypothetical protein
MIDYFICVHLRLSAVPTRISPFFVAVGGLPEVSKWCMLDEVQMGMVPPAGGDPSCRTAAGKAGVS